MRAFSSFQNASASALRITRAGIERMPFAGTIDMSPLFIAFSTLTLSKP